MTEEYLLAKIKEALVSSDGDKQSAQKLLITWAVRDPTLLIGLTRPHLRAIIAARIEHALRPPRKTESGKASQFSKKDIDEMIAAKPLGEKRTSTAIVPPPKSSARQASAMRALVEAFKSKKK